MVLGIGLKGTAPTVVKVTAVRMNIVSSTVLKPSKMRTFPVKVSSTIVVPCWPVTAVRASRLSPPSACGRGRCQALYRVARIGCTVADGRAGI